MKLQVSDVELGVTPYELDTLEIADRISDIAERLDVAQLAVEGVAAEVDTDLLGPVITFIGEIRKEIVAVGDDVHHSPADAAEGGPLEQLVAELAAVEAEFNAPRGRDHTAAEERALDTATKRIGEKIIATDARTPLEAVAVLEMARASFVGVNAPVYIRDRVTLSAFDKALSVLKAIAA